MDFGFWILLAIYVATPVGIFLCRNFFRAWIEKGVEHSFNTRLEQLRAELRKTEEEFKSSLRQKENDISALRDGALSGHMQRQGLLDKRRFEAIERLWAAVNSLSSYRNLAMFMSLMNAEMVAKRAPREPQLRGVFAGMTKAFNPNSSIPDNPAKNERPYLSQLSWAYFVAFQTVVQGAFSYTKMLEAGTENPDFLF